MGIVPKGFQNIGYYLVEPIIPPACFDLPCKRLLSLGDCIANIYPPQTEDLSPRMMKLAEEARFSPAESRFSRLKDALVFYKEFSEKADGLRIVGQFAAKDIAGRFISENDFCPCEENLEPKMLLGGEILGFDGGLHSYLCNGLDKNLRERFAIRWNGWGLIENSYEEMRTFAAFIQGQGEPVDWLPYLLFDYTP